MTRLLLILSLFVVTPWCFAKSMNGTSDTIAPPKVEVQNFEYLAQLDSMAHWLFEDANKMRDTTKFSLSFNDSMEIPRYSDSIIRHNMAMIPSEIPLELNPFVQRYIEVYAYKRRSQVSKMLMLSEMYFPIFEEALDRKDMPHELKYLPIVESALNPNAVSRAGATGIWQIMYATGRFLGLKTNSYIDERRDPYRSTEAALDYLEKMHKIYGDWLMVIAAYNCGPGNVNKAIRRSGGKRTYWEIRPWLPRETRGYVPAFIGATYVLSHFEEYGYRPAKPALDINAIDTVMIYDQVTLSKIASHIVTDVSLLALLNPSLKKRSIPASNSGYALRLPINKLVKFEELRDSIFKAPTPAELIATKAEEEKPSAELVKVYYRIKPGDNLGFVAEWYDVSLSNLRYWNGLKGNTIRAGQTLRIFVPENRQGQYADINSMTFKQKQALNGKSTTTVSSMAPATNTNSGKYLTYTVKAGDNLGFIAEWYGCSSQSIRNWNGIYGNTIRAGQSLKIYVSSTKMDYYRPVNDLSFAEKQARVKGTTTSTSPKTSTTSSSNKVYHTVRSGDTIWEIAKKYPGSTIEGIKRANNISNHKGIKPGMKLIIEM